MNEIRVDSVTAESSTSGTTVADTTQLLLMAEGVAKSFSGVPALRDGRLNLRPGSVHALCGGNGAGKSTFLNILMGILQRDRGTIRVSGKDVFFSTPRQALDAGISIITQELNPVRGMTVAENLFLGREPKRLGYFVDYRTLNEQAANLLEELHIPLKPRRLMRDLSVAETQLIEIAKALSIDARIIIMDEPTSALGEREADQLFSFIRHLTGLGKGIIFVSHRLTEIFEIADDYTVLRDGRYIESGRMRDIDLQRLIRQIIGRDFRSQFRSGTASAEARRAPTDLQKGKPLVEVEGLTCPGKFQGVSLSLYPGEIVGLYGLLGSGRSDFVRALFGLEKKVSGRMVLNGRELIPRHPKEAMRQGVVLVTEDRKEAGLVLSLSVRDNISLASLRGLSLLGFVQKRQETPLVEAMVKRFAIRVTSLKMLVRNMSGGNQQKVMLARCLMTTPKILLLDEPTRGIDEGAKQEIYAFMTQFIESGGGIVMVSSEGQEVMGMSDRIIVFRKGRVNGQLVNDGVAQEELVQLAS
jgi:putative xylitol transport system ATP-binding protein